MSDLKDVTIYNEGWVADCDFCMKTFAWERTKTELMRGLRQVRDRHQANRYACIPEHNGTDDE